MSYSEAAQSEAIETNYVIKIGEEYYAKKSPDSGLIIPNEHLIIDDPMIKGADADMRRASTPVGSVTFKLKDEAEFITRKIMNDEKNFLEKNVIVYAGFITGSFDFSSYRELSSTKIKSVTKIANGYSIRSAETTSELSNSSYAVESKLDIDITDVSTSLTLQDVSDFPTSGLLKIGSEIIRYTNKLDNNLSGLTRGSLLSTAAEHLEGEDVFLVTEIVSTNPITAFLQLALSGNGDGTNHAVYDVLPNGPAISPDKINIAKFEDLRTKYFTDEEFTLRFYSELDTLKFIEKEILQPTNLRIFTNNGKIDGTVLDQLEFEETTREVGEDTIIGTPTWSLTSEKIHNVINIEYDYDIATNKFLTSKEFRNEDSIATFGEKKPLKFKFKGLTTDLNGEVIAAKRATQLLNRLGTARGAITFNAQLDESDINIGQDIYLSHRYLPQQGAGLGMSDQLEVVSRNINLKAGTCSYKLEYTSFTGIRVAYIAPAPKIENVISQKAIEVANGALYSEGFAVVLWNDTLKQYLPDAVNFVESVEGNTLNFVNEFTTPLTTELYLRFADYDYASTSQKARYAFIGGANGFEIDETKSYQIIF